MTRDEAKVPGGPLPLPSSGADDEIDPELVALPDPPRRGRTITVLVLALTALASLAMVFALRRDVRYALASSSSPSDLGDLGHADPAALAQLDNRYVTAHGMVGVGGGILFDRLFQSDSFRALPVAGRQDLWVEVRVPLGKENARWEPPKAFTGRLVRFDATGPRHRGLEDAIERATQQSVPEGAYLLVDGETPGGSMWSGALAVLFLAFAGWNVVALARLLRRVK